MELNEIEILRQNNELLKNIISGDTDSIIKIAENYLLYSNINDSKEALGFLETIIDKDQEIYKECNTLLKNKKSIVPNYITMGQLLTSMNIYIKVLEKKDQLNPDEEILIELLKKRIERIENFLTEDLRLEKDKNGKYTSSPLMFGPAGESVVFVPTNGNAYQTKLNIYGQEIERFPFNKEKGIPIFVPATGDYYWKNEKNRLNNQFFKTIQKPTPFSINNNLISQENNSQYKIPQVYYPQLDSVDQIIQKNNNQYKIPQIYYPQLDSVDQIIQKNNNYLQKCERYYTSSNNIKNLNTEKLEKELINNFNNISHSSKEMESNIDNSLILS